MTSTVKYFKKEYLIYVCVKRKNTQQYYIKNRREKQYYVNRLSI